MLICKNANNAIRWKQGERLHHLFEQRCDGLHAANGPCDAVVTDDAVLTFRDLDNRANQLARYLLAHGMKAGDRIGLLFDKGRVETYVALLAVLKINAAYVPFDASFPNDRIAFIMEDAGVKALISLSAFRSKLEEFGVNKVFLDDAAREIEAQPAGRLLAQENAPVDQLAYLIYTSGTTGKPKGVAIEHASICNFVRVAAEVYGMRPGDRCYQGMTIAFDFSVEELWVPLLAGATLVPVRPGANLVGSDLADFLFEKHVTVLACVPTLLATIERDLPELRILLVSGEACPQNLVVRWHRAGRSILNAYGPTEATVTATLTELYPDKPVTVGGPLPTYTIVVLDPDKSEEIADGGLGEIGIAGIGLAEGYLNRPDLTQQKFIPDFLDIPNNPSKRIYRSGDLGRINESGEVEFLGRIDTQVKIRGYRIELTEIESILMQIPQIAQAVVDKYESEPGAIELVAFYSLKQGASPLAAGDIAAMLRKQLPGYMVPAYIEELPVIPMTSSNKADRKNLPRPKGPRVAAGSGNYVAPRTKAEETLARALIEVMKIERVSVDDHFFQDLGAHSLLMARYGAEIRKAMGVSVSMRDIYLNPTIGKLARLLDAVPAEETIQTTRMPLRIPPDFDYYTCGALQLLYYLGYGIFGLWVTTRALVWAYAAVGNAFDFYLRLAAVSAATFLIFSAIPIVVKWLVVGRWKPETIPIWSLRYFRFWVVRNLTQANPMVLLSGTPLYNAYLRLLGARIGRNSVVAAQLMPVCTDLITIGANTILKRGATLPGYKAESNYIHTGAISIGDNAFVGEATVLDINTTMEDNTQLGHTSSLQAGQRVPAGKHYHGSPAQETTAEYCVIEPMRCSALRRVLYSVFLLATGLLVLAPLGLMLAFYAYPYFDRMTSGTRFLIETSGSAFFAVVLEIMAISLAVFIGALVMGLLVMIVAPRLLYLVLKENKTYVLYGMHYMIFRAISTMTNSSFYCILFGDSSFIVRYLRWIGYKLKNVVQMGSNFGQAQRHDIPYLCEIGTGTMVSDGLSMLNATMSNSSFRLNKIKIGEHNYFGNNIYYPAAGKTGSNCLLATKVMIPIDGPVCENVGLLGSPCFEIPRVTDRDMGLRHAIDDRTRQERIRAKERHNIVTMVAFLASIWAYVFATLLFGFITLLYFPRLGVVSVFAYGTLMSVLGILWFILVERASLGFGRLKPQVVSMYDKYFWYHERHWKLAPTQLMQRFKGTPFKNLVSHLLGIKVGRKIFDDGCSFCEKTLIEIGDYANLNERALIQGHSLEEGVFKSDHIKVGNGCTVGCGALVHYGVTMGDEVVVDPDSFVMKGEILDAHSTWRGNPAKAVGHSAAPVATPAAVERLVAAQ